MAGPGVLPHCDQIFLTDQVLQACTTTPGFVLETGSRCIAQAGPNLSILLLWLVGAGITGMHHHNPYRYCHLQSTLLPYKETEERQGCDSHCFLTQTGASCPSRALTLPPIPALGHQALTTTILSSGPNTSQGPAMAVLFIHWLPAQQVPVFPVLLDVQW